MQCNWCGHVYPDDLGKYGCPNCLAEGLVESPPVRRCPHDDQICRHNCEGSECWRELDGS